MQNHEQPSAAHDRNPLDATGFNRRNALAMIGVGAATLGGITALAGAQQSSPVRQDPHMPHSKAGFDLKSGQYVLPDLPYAYDALEPHIDAQTMQIHHDKHHAGYVKGLNSAMSALAEIRSGKRSADETKHWERQLAFNGSGHFLHVIFWNSMSPNGGGAPSGSLAEQIEKDFGSFRAFSEQFQAAANSVEGSGWGLVVFDPIGEKLMVMQAEKHQNQAIWGVVPMMGIDVWEHAYYLKYQNKRADYVSAFMNVVNWDFVSRELEGTKKMLTAGRST